MYRLVFLFLFSIASWCMHAQVYKTQPLSDDIHSIEVQANKQWNSYPVMKLNSGEYIHIGFDRVSDNSDNRLRYKLIHCGSEWNKSGELSEIDYIDGFDDNVIDSYANSINTTVSYTHFNLKIPNKDVTPKLSGNYAVLVYDEDEGDEDTILLTACFSVTEDVVDILPEVSTVTDIDSNKEHHQLSFDINYKLNLRDVKNDFKVFVRQNNRIDNERKYVLPAYIMPSKLRYTHKKELIFPAGNEFRRFDMSSHRYNGKNIAHIEYKSPNYFVYVVPDRVRAGASYNYDQDQGGRVIYRDADNNNVETEGDYFFTQLTLHVDETIPHDIYVNGALSYNRFNDDYKMLYDKDNNEYYLSLFLKQGIYNYQYLTKNGTDYTTHEVEGNYYETENEYSIYVYYRPMGQRYDSLVGFKYIQSRQK